MLFAAPGFHSAMAQAPSSAWLEQLGLEARANGVSESTITAVTQQIELLPNVIAMDRSQPEFISQIGRAHV